MRCGLLGGILQVGDIALHFADRTAQRIEIGDRARHVALGLHHLLRQVGGVAGARKKFWLHAKKRQISRCERGRDDPDQQIGRQRAAADRAVALENRHSSASAVGCKNAERMWSDSPTWDKLGTNTRIEAEPEAWHCRVRMVGESRNCANEPEADLLQELWTNMIASAHMPSIHGRE